MSQNSYLRVSSSVLATFQENQADYFFFSFLFCSIHKRVTVKDLGFCTYVSIHISLHHKLLSLLLTQYKPCTGYKYLIGVNDVFCIHDRCHSVCVIPQTNMKWLSFVLVWWYLERAVQTWVVWGFMELEYRTLRKCQWTTIYVLVCTFQSKKLFCHLIC